ncbi:hypothetical protein W02_12200 [Nitrospira sp. KM1]|uniref:hypothetical protein n=1 Tax=Nitrospira sp. KM1 TaxID=1936990 RepID=UPI0013A7512A|nr:hypothetical protein [Nitrospira sp. KM1]BCA54080.1 hypothetical protein W02_12200 [Nitrospira sp. KM1]
MKHVNFVLGYGLGFFLLAGGLVWNTDASGQAWPNEPPGSQLITDFSFSTTGGQGWSYNWWGQIVDDATAPGSPSKVMQYRRPLGSAGAGGDAWYDFPDSNEIYVGFWWKPSNPFQGWPHLQNKVAFLWGPPGQGQLVWYMFGNERGGPYSFGVQLETPWSNCHLGSGFGDCPGSYNLFPNRGGGTIALGQWHRIEIYAKASSSTSSRNGILRWWMDGVLLGDYSTVNLASPWTWFQFTPAWDSFDSTQTEEFSHRFDHARISKPNGSGSPAPASDAQPPASPTGLRVQ